MLSTIRDNKKSVIGLLIAGFMAFLMVGFGMNASGGYESAQEQTAIRVNSHEISGEQYYRQLELLNEAYRNQLGENYASLRNFLNIEQRAIDSLIEEYILKDFIDSLGLTASTAQIESYIARLPFFQKFGLTRETYSSFLHAQGFTGEQLEQKTREELGGLQFQSILGDLSSPSDQELRAAFREQNTKFDFEYVSFRPEELKAKVDTSNEEKLKSYFTAHADVYRKPRTIRYSYVKFEPTNFLAKVELNEDDLRDLYQQKQGQFYEPKQLKLRQIVFNKSKENGSAVEEMMSGKAAPATNTGNEAKKAKAAAVIEKLKAGEDFAKLATAESEDPATKASGGDRGWILPSELPKEVRPIAERVLKGKFSDVIETDSQFYIVLLEDLKERRLKPFEQVRAQLEQDLRMQDAPEYARIEAERFYDRFVSAQAAQPQSLVEFAAKESRSAVDSQSLVSVASDANDAPGLMAKIANLSERDRQTVRVGTNDYVVEILETKDAYVPEFNEVRAKVTDDFVQAEAKLLAKEEAEKVLASLQPAAATAERKTLPELAKSLHVSVKSTGLISRAEPGKEPLLMKPEAKQLLFALSESKPVVSKVITDLSGEYSVATLKAKVSPDEKATNDALLELRAKEKEAAHSRLGNFVYKSLKATADVWVNPKLLENRNTAPEDV